MEGSEEIEELRQQIAGLRAEIEELRGRPPPRSHRRVDTRTRYQGVFARHQVRCSKTLEKSRRCRCMPSFYGMVWDSAIHLHRRTERRSTVREAKVLRDELLGRVREGTAGTSPARVSLEQVKESFIEDCRAGIALNNRGEPYKPKAITNLDSSLNSLPESIRRKRFSEVTGWELQEAIDDYRRRGLSSSRIHSIICAVRSLYTWGVHRGRALTSPATRLRLPVIRSKTRGRIAKPGEFAALLEPLAPRDALPWALAAYGTARHQEIQILEWPDVEFENNAILLAADDRAHKSEAARRLVPMVDQLRRRLLAEWVRQGEPKGGRVCPPRRKSKSGLLCLNELSKRVARIWRELGLEPIGLQDSRHTAATWLDHAGVSPKVVSVLMGHKTPSTNLRFGAAPITLRCYTHVLDGELERARDLLDVYLAEREAKEGGSIGPQLQMTFGR